MKYFQFNIIWDSNIKTHLMMLSYLKIFILNQPLFNLANQPNDKIKLIMKSNLNNQNENKEK